VSPTFERLGAQVPIVFAQYVEEHYGCRVLRGKKAYTRSRGMKAQLQLFKIEPDYDFATSGGFCAEWHSVAAAAELVYDH
jgi:hypothetical protein